MGRRTQKFETGKHMLYPEEYKKAIQKWLIERYGRDDAKKIWRRTHKNYIEFLQDCPDYGGAKNGHANAIYGGLLIFALYPALPNQPPIEELQNFMNSLFMGSFTKLGKIFNLNRRFDMFLIDKVFKKVGDKDRRQYATWPAGFCNVAEPFDKEHQAARYHFTKCPNAEFAKAHDLLHVLPLLCNCDFYGIEEIHGQLIRCGTCGNSDICDYCVVGSGNPLAKEYEVVRDDNGFLVSRKKDRG